MPKCSIPSVYVCHNDFSILFFYPLLFAFVTVKISNHCTRFFVFSFFSSWLTHTHVLFYHRNLHFSRLIFSWFASANYFFSPSSSFRLLNYSFRVVFFLLVLPPLLPVLFLLPFIYLPSLWHSSGYYLSTFLHIFSIKSSHDIYYENLIMPQSPLPKEIENSVSSTIFFVAIKFLCSGGIIFMLHVN